MTFITNDIQPRLRNFDPNKPRPDFCLCGTMLPLMSKGIQPQATGSVSDTVHSLQGDDAQLMAALYDEYAAVVLGFLEKLSDDREKAEELLQAVFLALPARIQEFDPSKGRLIAWILRLARATAAGTMNAGNASTNSAIHAASQNVGETNRTRKLTLSGSGSVVELLYVKGYTFAQAAAELGIEEHAVRTLVRNELKTYRKGNPDA